MLMAIGLPTHLVDLTVGAIADHLDELKDASGILQQRKESELLNIVELQGECQQIISIQAKQQSKQLQRNKENAPKTLFPRQSENFKQRKKLRQRHEMRTGRGLYTDSVTLKRQKQHEHHLSLLCSAVLCCLFV